ncbi:MAG: DUF4383 domain-containing protein [Acidobacteriota bacterium]|nr:DUF4383 domain-containing protein [Acidobacteriota bacterium]
MANIVAVMIGVLFILIGLAGFAFNNLLGAHLTLAHNLIHLVSGAASLYIGLKCSNYAAKVFCWAFGTVYLSLGVFGYWFGFAHGASYLPLDAQDHGVESNMFRVIPGVLELGSIDHIIHVVLGAVYIIAAMMTRTTRNAAEFFEGNPE